MAATERTPSPPPVGPRPKTPAGGFLTLIGVTPDGRRLRLADPHDPAGPEFTVEIDARLRAALGAQPSVVRTKTDTIRENENLIQWTREAEQRIVKDWAQGIIERDTEQVGAAIKRLADWNRDNPEHMIRINPQQIRQRVLNQSLDADTRQMRRAPRELRGSLQ